MSQSPPNYKTNFLLWSSVWIVMCLSALFFLPGFSEYDTSKYLSIAHQMMDNHQYLIANWEGHVYSDKPPLLFWLIIGGWKLFGVNDWWPQAIVLIAATATLLVSINIAKQLWPNTKVSLILPIVMMGTFHWYWFAKEIRVDSLLTLAVALSLWSVIKTLDKKPYAWLVYTLALGLGGFAKGPVILAFVFLPTLLLPTLLGRADEITAKWYGLLGLTTLVGMCIPLTWAIPAIKLGGQTFSHELFVDQIAHRVHQHQESKLFYLLRLPLIILPWSFYPPLWRGLRNTFSVKSRSAEMLCAFIIITSLIFFSFFGQKLPHYLYPIIPILSLLIARSLSLSTQVSARDQWPMGIIVMGFGLFCLLYPSMATWLPQEDYARGYFLNEIALYKWGTILFAIGALFFGLHCRTLQQQVLLLACGNILLTLFISNSVLPHYTRHIQPTLLFDQLSAAHYPDIALTKNSAVINAAIISYLTEHHITLNTPDNLTTWQRAHPNGLILTSDLMDFKKQPVRNWLFQERYNLLGVIPAKDYRD